MADIQLLDRVQFVATFASGSRLALLRLPTGELGLSLHCSKQSDASKLALWAAPAIGEPVESWSLRVRTFAAETDNVKEMVAAIAGAESLAKELAQ